MWINVSLSGLASPHPYVASVPHGVPAITPYVSALRALLGADPPAALPALFFEDVLLPPSLPLGALYDALAAPPLLPGDPFLLRVEAAALPAAPPAAPAPDVAAFTSSLRAAACILAGATPGVEGALSAALSPPRCLAAFEGALHGGEAGARGLQLSGEGAPVPLRVLLRARARGGGGGGGGDTVVALQEAARPGAPLLAALRGALAAGAAYCPEAGGVVVADARDADLRNSSHEALLLGVPLHAAGPAFLEAPLWRVANAYRGADGFLTVALRRCAGFGRSL